MNQSRFLFVGNRGFVLHEMLALNLNVVDILAIKGSYLARELSGSDIEHRVINRKIELVERLANEDYDILISNGCPFIIPNEIFNKKQRFVNIHPSYLPDLRGKDPHPGAILMGRDSGATCHIMDAGIDTGPIISQVKIPYSQDLTVSLLYQLTFMAEKDAFNSALNCNFCPQQKQKETGGEIYYSVADSDKELDFTGSIDDVFRKIRAFSNASQGAKFSVKGQYFKTFDCEVVKNPYLLGRRNEFSENQIALVFESSIVLRKGLHFLHLKQVAGDIKAISPGDFPD